MTQQTNGFVDESEPYNFSVRWKGMVNG